MHIDADAFFASCEQAMNPKLKGKPVITGKERGIVAAASYEAKEKGVTRAMRLFEAKKVCPDVVMLPSNYETYSLFSIRMFEIIKRFSPDVEEYSIDEAFIDITGLRSYFHCSYEQIALNAQKTIEKELGITVSVGISLSKVLSKIGSKHKKPNGLTAIPGREIHHFLSNFPVGNVWGIGANGSALLKKFGINTALDFTGASENFVKKHFSKPYLEIWHELNGRSVYPVVAEINHDYQSISKSKTFTPPSTNESFIFAQLSKNLENACIKARRHKLVAKRLVVLLKRQNFATEGVELKISHPNAFPVELIKLLKKGFQQVYQENSLYRATGVVLSGLFPNKNEQYGLFQDRASIEKISRIYNVIDTLSKKYGKHTIQHGSSLPTKLQEQHEGERGDIPKRKRTLLKGENQRQRLGLPLLDMEV